MDKKLKKILIIEDNEANLYLTKFILEKNGYQVLEAREGIQGLELATKQKPDLILMDIQLPDIDGLEAVKRIRTAKTGQEIPIVALTSYAMVGDREKSLAAGCTGYIEKPINPDTFMAEIEKFL
jgi:CheY-like chemotaxis protein